MTDLVPFQFESHEIRIHVDSQGEPWWVLTDVCAALDLSNPSKVASRLKPEESMTLTFSYTVQNEPKMLAINEKGLYRLIMRSSKEEAERFQDWVFGDVLPSIRKTGKYEVSAAAPVPQLPSPGETVSLVTLSVDLLERLGQLTERDKLGYADMIRNATLPSSSRLLDTPQAHGFSAAERVGQLGYHLSAREKASIFPRLGKRLIDEYRSRYGSDPEKESRYVDGATRRVPWYCAEDASWVDPIIQSFLTSLGFASRGVPA
jgi:prophage antirepressor-like protein